MEQQIINLYQSGYSISKIEKIVNISYSRISSILKNNNIEVIDRQKIKFQSKLKEATDLYLSGESLTKISSKLCTSRNKLARYFKSIGVSVVNN